MKRQLLTLLTAAFCLGVFAQIDHQRVYSTFDNLPLAKADTFNNGADSSLGFNHYGRYWNNNYTYNAEFDFEFWSGWSLSNMTDTVTGGSENQFSAITGSGVSGTSNFMVSTGGGAYIKLDEATEISGAYFTNSTYVARDFENGSGFSKVFGGADGTDPDFFLLKIYSYLKGNIVDSTELYLADYRNADNSKDYILKDWTYVDFNNDPFSDILIDSVAFKYSSSDVGMFGMNTPAYFCMDDFNAVSVISSVEEPYLNIAADTFYNGSDSAGGFKAGYLYFANNYGYNAEFNFEFWSGWSYSSMLDNTTPGVDNQYSCINNEKANFYVAGGQNTEIRAPYLDDGNILYKKLNAAPWAVSFSVTNTSYAALDMEQGLSFGKKFGGADGNDPDYFRLLVDYIDSENSVLKVDTVYLADFRFTDNAKDYILKDWKEVKSAKNTDLAFHKLSFRLESSDVGMFGMNTPAYFCLSYEFDQIGSVSNRNQAIKVLAYPNPTSNKLNLEAENLIENVQIISLDGRILESGQNQVQSKNVTVNTAELTPGIYFAVVTTAKGTATKRFIKQ
jgi:hypothetical protein